MASHNRVCDRCFGTKDVLSKFPKDDGPTCRRCLAIERRAPHRAKAKERLIHVLADIDPSDSGHELDGKICSKCEDWKALTEFQKYGDGLQRWCRPCMILANKARRAEVRAGARRRVPRARMLTRRCPGCGECKQISDFSSQGRQIRNLCKVCECHKQLYTKDGLLNSQRLRLIRRWKEEHPDEGEVIFPFEAVKKIYDSAEGINDLFPGKLVSFDPFASWRASLALIDCAHPPSENNVMLTSQEFTNSAHATPWTKAKIEELRVLINTYFDMEKFERGITPTPKRNKRGQRCCDPTHERRAGLSGCYTCNLNRARAHRVGSVLAFLKHILSQKLSSKRNTCHLTLADLIEIVRRQGGLCTISKVPLVFRRSGWNWMASLERINPSLQYTKDNCCFIAIEFQTSCNRGEKECGPGEQAQWTAEKFLEWTTALGWYDKEEQKDGGM
jgi:hypothetical protein